MRGHTGFYELASQTGNSASQTGSFASQVGNFHPATPLFMRISENIIEFLIKSLKETLLKGFEQKILKNFCSCLYQNSQNTIRIGSR